MSCSIRRAAVALQASKKARPRKAPESPSPLSPARRRRHPWLQRYKFSMRTVAKHNVDTEVDTMLEWILLTAVRLNAESYSNAFLNKSEVAERLRATDFHGSGSIRLFSGLSVYLRCERRCQTNAASKDSQRTSDNARPSHKSLEE